MSARKAQYINSPGYRKAEVSRLVRRAWIAVGIGVLFILAMLSGMLELEGKIPPQDDSNISQIYEVR